MDPTLYNAAMEGIIVDADFILADHLQRDEENGYQVTPKGNTVLHVAALYGQSGFLGQVLEITSALLCCKNKKNETALHLAANKGHSEVARVLLRAAGEGNKETLMRMTDDDGDTALHKAVRSGGVDTVRLLVKEDPDFEFPANKAGETPLYLAAESGFLDCLLEILRSSIRPTYGGPCGRTALHAAMIQKHSDCATSLWQWNKSLCEESDQWDWNPLHYAVKRGLKLVVREMLGWKKSLAYIQAGSGNDWTTTIHIAASKGYANMINELLNHCPDCWEMLNSSGQNALHVAISNNKIRVIRFIQNSKEFHNLIYEADNDGNTPLHLLAASTRLRVPLNLSGYPRAKMLFNKKKQTPLDIALSGTETTQMEKWSFKRRLRLRLGGRDFEIRGKNMQEPEDEMESRGTNTQQRENKARRDKIRKLQDIMTATQIHLVVAALLVTVTFAAGLTVPGGFESDPGPNKGMAILIRKTAFHVFAVSNAIAFTCSAGAVFSYFFIGDNTAATKKLKIILPLFGMGDVLQHGAMLGVVTAFVTGTYATLAHSVGLAVTVCVIGCASFLVYSALWFAFY
ncbi:ankyrin repeat-containing protein ITN1-like [Lycium barbarum]|uniref:ankyrin repeat-containing protein ITN1-like n=1 Tax=Lycium barbarum TaxID=112863 RepID=UPI00293EB46E|nr:ankyrin repeat-containing protein ITN1-like [Lycium barbarum]